MATLEIIHTNLEDIAVWLRPSCTQALMDEPRSTQPQMCERRSGKEHIIEEEEEYGLLIYRIAEATPQCRKQKWDGRWTTTSPNVVRFACRECPAQLVCFDIPGSIQHGEDRATLTTATMSNSTPKWIEDVMLPKKTGT